VAGHAYGDPFASEPGLHPPFLDALSRSSDLEFVVLAGDVVRRGDRASWNRALADLEGLGLPFYVAMGNHDREGVGPELLAGRFGATSHRFDIGSERFVFLDTQEAGAALSAGQLDLLRRALDGSDAVRNVFVFVHELIWLNDVRYRGLRANRSDAAQLQSNYWSDVHPLLLRNAGKEIFLVAGDVGTAWAIPALFDQPAEHIRLIATGMGGNERENFLRVEVRDGAVSFSVVPLDGSPAVAVERYDVDTVRGWLASESNEDGVLGGMRPTAAFALGAMAAVAVLTLARALLSIRGRAKNRA